MKFDQTERLIKLGRPFDPATCYATSLTVTEEISQLFRCQVEFLSTDLDLHGSQIVGQMANIELLRFDDDGGPEPSRFFHGLIRRLQGLDVSVHQDLVYRRYRIEVVPQLWLLTQLSDCFIFFPELESKSIRQVVDFVFDKAELGSLDRQVLCNRLSEIKVEHCVQYRETDYNFLARQLEQYGAHYYFTHSDGMHELKICDRDSKDTCMESSVEFPRQTNRVQDNCILSWERQFDFVSGAYIHTDYNFKQPADDLTAGSSKIDSELAEAVAGSEIYDYPGEYQALEAGEKLARIRQEEHEAEHGIIRGTSSCKTFSAGHTFELKSHPDQSHLSYELGRYRLLRVHHQAVQPFEKGAHIQYSNSFECAPADRAYRPPRVTPKPLISGIQTAVVTGPEGEEIYTDPYGRIKVVFHWDRVYKPGRHKTEGANCCCWVRVAQSSAGNGWGSMFLPRIGQEVVVEFLEGDPDQPLVVGSVYNARQMPPYDPVEHKTRSYMKTCSSMDGEGYNELMFEDLAGSEMVYVHAQRNMDFRVRNDSMEAIYGNRYQRIGWGDDDEELGGNKVEQIRLNKEINVQQDQNEKIEGTYRLTVGYGHENQDGVSVQAENPGIVHYDFEKSWLIHVGEEGLGLTVEGDFKQQVDGNNHQTIVGDLEVTSDGNARLESGGNIDLVAGGIFALKSSQDMHLDGGTNLVLEAGTGLTLKVGGNFISITPAGIFIKGAVVGINSGGAALSGPGAQSAAPGNPETAEQAEPMAPVAPHAETFGSPSNL